MTLPNCWSHFAPPQVRRRSPDTVLSFVQVCASDAQNMLGLKLVQFDQESGRPKRQRANHGEGRQRFHSRGLNIGRVPLDVSAIVWNADGDVDCEGVSSGVASHRA